MQVHDRGESAVPKRAPRSVRISREQGVRDHIVSHLVLHSVHNHDLHIPDDLPRGQQARAAVGIARRRRHLPQQPGKRRRGLQRRQTQFGGHPLHQGPQHHQDETRAQSSSHARHHHGHFHPLLAALLFVVSIIYNTLCIVK